MRLDGNRIKIEISARIGSAEITLQKLLNLAVGDVIFFTGVPERPLDILANQFPVGKGVASINRRQRIEIRLTEKL